ncbi:hypothetical protein OVW19_29675, partial [Klebsiella pneumoniae]|nr:hypothetical protein [Klebsiella pneumoniae]
EFIIRMRLEDPTQDPFALVQRAIVTGIPNTQISMLRTEQVGPKVGRELSEKAIWAVLGSLGGILLYVGVRYEFKFAFGAVAALFH